VDGWVSERAADVSGRAAGGISVGSAGVPLTHTRTRRLTDSFGLSASHEDLLDSGKKRKGLKMLHGLISLAVGCPPLAPWVSIGRDPVRGAVVGSGQMAKFGEFGGKLPLPPTSRSSSSYEASGSELSAQKSSLAFTGWRELLLYHHSDIDRDGHDGAAK